MCNDNADNSQLKIYEKVKPLITHTHIYSKIQLALSFGDISVHFYVIDKLLNMILMTSPT